MNPKSFASVILLAIAAATLLSGCSTIKGLGEDLQAAGSKITDVAQKAK